MGWQKEFTLGRKAKGCHLVTDEILSQIQPGLKNVQVGMLFLFIKHTSASLSVNENYDPGICCVEDSSLSSTTFQMSAKQIWTWLSTILFPRSLSASILSRLSVIKRDSWLHTDEGPDDSVSHTKASLVGSSISIPITNCRLNLGTWQGIYLTEFRRMAHTRTVVATIL
ncbi:hypothetical protein MSAN_02154000 [Mycena sanguinolenta]|uniref:Uncharacterized protein n=1 Tax=Mycena sanguinolenta TaxID=230812 RepID=A0A8H7CKE2_9AGAR|nr:hypothetical protein MSAN_02154000 [Mycena sanguinolenta]